MALPTIKPSWVKTFKTPAEITIKNRERSEQKFTQNATNYACLKSSEVYASKISRWSSQQSYDKSMQSVNKMFDKVSLEEKKHHLQKRRQKLQQMLSKENNRYKEELKMRRAGGSLSIMQQRVEAFQADKEAKRKQLSEEKLYKHWKNNDPRLREVKSHVQEKEVIESWKGQLDEKQQQTQSYREFDQRLESEMAERNKEALLEQQKIEERKHAQQIEIAEQLKEQMRELREKERKAELLNQEESRLIQHNKLIAQAEKDREVFEEQRKKQDLGRVLVRQYKQQLQRKSRQIQIALEYDLKMLKEIAEKKSEEHHVETTRREKMRSDAFSMQQVVSDQLRLEKIREAELNSMYQEEASREWRKREYQWEKERTARDKLIKDVLVERRQQIEEKVERLHQQQAEGIREREQLLQRLENDELLTHREENEKVLKRKQRQEEMQKQVNAKEFEKHQAEEEKQLQMQLESEQKRREENLFQSEAARITGVRPSSSFGRKRVSFT